MSIRRDRHRDPALPRRDPRRADRRPAPAHRRDALAEQGARRRPLAGRAARDDRGARALLGDRVRLRADRGAAERAAAVHDRDRRGRHPLHPRPLEARGRAAADHDPRLARLGDRAARHRRPADRPDRARRQRRGRVPPRAARPFPGYGFSAEPTELGWNLGRIARAWAELMRRLGYTRYVAQGGDVGAGVTDAMGRQAPDGLLGIHTNLLVPALNDLAALPAETEQERAALAAINTFQTSGIRLLRRAGHAARRRSATRCWTHPSRWRRGCSTTTPTPTTRSPRAFVDGQPVGQPHPRPHPRQHHAVLADRHGRLGGPVVLGGLRAGRAGGRPGSAAGRRSRSASRRSRARSGGRRAAGSRRLPERRLLQRGRQGRPLRRLGGARALRAGDARRVQPLR